MDDLLDANVWLALSVPEHAHHSAARRYWEGASGGRGLCRVMALALLRHLTAREMFGTAAAGAATAWGTLQDWLALPAVQWLDEPAGIDEWMRGWADSIPLRGADWTDAYLAAFTMASGRRLVTFDRGFRRFADLDCLLLEE